MNERIKELLPKPFRKQGQQIASDFDTKVFCDMYSKEQMVKFAELIVKECMEQVWYTREDSINGNISEVIKERMTQHFGVEE